MALEQEGFRWRNDDGSETTATWRAAQDSNISLSLDIPVRLRVVVNVSTNPAPATSKYRLEYKRTVDAVWTPVRPSGPGKILLSTSANVAAGGENTTAQLTAPSGKSSGTDFVSGRMWDDEVGLDDVPIGDGKYTELEFSVVASSANGAVAGDIYQFRVRKSTPAGGGGNEAETDAIVAEMDVVGNAPDGTRTALINDLVLALKTAGVWSKIDRMYVLAAHEESASLVNWISPGTDPLARTDGGTMTVPADFLTDRGWRGNGASGTAWSMLSSTDGINTYTNFQQDSAHAAHWVQADAVSVDGNTYGVVGGGSTFTGWPRVSSGYFRSRINQATNFDATNPSGSDLGFFISVRRNSTDIESYRNGSSLGTGSIASVAVPTTNANLRVCGVGTDATDHRIAFFCIGSQLSGTEAVDLYNAVAAYMSAVGV